MEKGRREGKTRIRLRVFMTSKDITNLDIVRDLYPLRALTITLFLCDGHGSLICFIATVILHVEER